MNVADISEEDIRSIRSRDRFFPESKEAVQLFQVAARIAGLPENWAQMRSLHTILKRESNGRVGVLNYTIKDMDLSEFRMLAIHSSKKNPL